MENGKGIPTVTTFVKYVIYYWILDELSTPSSSFGLLLAWLVQECEAFYFT